MNGMEGMITPEMAGPAAVGIMALMGAFFMVFVVIFIILYVFMALCLQKIAQKTKTENAWMAWVPVANIFLMAMIAKKPLWWAILFFIPIINLVAVVIIGIGMAEARGKEGWIGALQIIPGVNLIVLGYLAFSK